MPQIRFRNAKVIANFSSGQLSRQQQPHIRQLLGRNGIEVAEVAEAKGVEATVRLCRQWARNGCELVVGIGGDGTLNTIVNGLAGTDTVLGVVPAGTANVFARQLGIPSNLEGAMRAIAHGQVISMDLGKLNDHYFSCTSGIGFDAHVLKHVGPRAKKLSGPLAYILTGVRSFFGYRFRRVHLTIGENGKAYAGYMALVVNSKYYGGDYIFAPEASIVDGALDLIVFHRRDIRTVVRYLAGVRSGSVTAQPDVTYLQTTRVHVLPRGKHPLHLDGEYFGSSPAEIRLVPRALRVITVADQ